jgi:predicted house-cleaning NTP pyrophosphatase (Maf/HAM1 superfamily)
MLLMLVLASNSPRRKQLLALGGWTFSVMPAQVDERVRSGESPREYVHRLAREKARFVAEQFESRAPDILVLAADTAVVDLTDFQGDKKGLAGKNGDNPKQILGKPADVAEAESMLRRLRGRTHQVNTGLVVLRVGDGRMLSRVCVTDVPMRLYSDREMRDYIKSGDPFDKAGAYAIQHPEFRPVEGLQGCYANVMGLPVCELWEMLVEFGLKPKNDIVQTCQAELGVPCALYTQATDASKVG